MALRCSRCGAEVAVGARFCSACGLPQTPDEPIVPAPSATEPPARRAREIAGERKPVTALFADVVGSVTLAERMDPEDWSMLMSGTIGSIETIVRRYDGTIAKLLGDGVLALFGAETAHEDDPERAVRAAIEMLQAVADRPRGAAGGHDLAIRIGINTGLALVGTVSGGDGESEGGSRAAMSAYGDTVNVAARLQSAAEPGRALMTAATYRLVRHAIEARDLGESNLRGRSEAVHAYEVVGVRAAPASARGVEGLRSPLVGRLAQLALLEGRARALARGRGSAAVVVGEPGIGKSRLIAELRGRLAGPERQQPAWVESRATSYGTSVADQLLIELVRALLAIDDGHDADPALRHLVGEPLTADEARDLAGEVPETLRRRYLAAIADLVRSQAARRPLVVLLEDLHWADGSSVSALIELLPVLAELPVLLLATMRDEPDSSGARLGTALRGAGGALDEIALGPLSDEDARALVGNLLTVDNLPEAVRTRILTRADGNPFFVEETLRMLLDRGAIHARDGRYIATDDIARVEIPETIHGLLLARIDRLAPESRRTARVAAVIGREFATELLAQVLADAGVDRAAVAGDLERLDAAGLVRTVDDANSSTNRFRHALIQEAAYDSLLRAERSALHRTVGEALERADPAELDARAPRIGEHFEAAGEPARALPWVRRAADVAARRYALVEAVAQYRRAIALALELGRPTDELTELYLRGGRAIELQDRYGDAVALYETMRTAARGRDDRRLEVAAIAALATGQVIAVAETGEAPAIDALAHEGLGLARELGDRAAEAKLLWTLLLANRFGWGDAAAGLEYGRQALALATEAGLDEQAALAAQDLAAVLGTRGQLAESAALLDRSIAYWLAVGNLPHAATGLRGRAELLWLMGDVPGARAAAEQALAIDERTGNIWGRSTSRIMLGIIRFETGDISGGQIFFGEALEIAEASSLLVLRLSSSAMVAYARVSTGELEAARGMIEGLRAAVEGQFQQIVDIGRTLVAFLELEAGDAEAARRAAEPGAGLDEPMPFALTTLPLWVAPIDAALLARDAASALPLIERIVELTVRTGARAWQPDAFRLRGLARHGLGQEKGAAADLREALSIARELGLVHCAARAERALAATGLGAGQTSGSVTG